MSEGAKKKEEKPRKFQAIRGTRDLLPPDTALWNHVEQTAREVFATFGYGEIRPPIFEATELFARGVGGDTDIVAKEMYSFREGGFGDPQDMQDSMDFVNAQNSPVLMGRFLRELEADLENGGLAKTPENQNAISTIRSVSRELFAIPEPTEEGPEEAAEARLFEYFGLRKSLDDKLRDAWLVLKGKEMMSLRPEATASVCRAYIEHNMQQWPQPVRLYYIGPMFRRERPQKGRYRQFYQIGAEVLEASRPDAAKDAAKELAKDAAVDAELIEMLMTFFDRVGLQGTELSVNSIGHSAPPVDGKNVCRRGYVEALKAALEKVKDQLGADSQRRIETNPLRVLDSKLEHEQAIIAKLPHIADHLCDECKTHYAELKRQLDLRGFKGKYKENWRLVRGLDYYMRTTFEITARGLGSQDAVCGGGRYDGLVELLGGPPTKGIGFAIGEDRVILSLQEPKSQAAVTSHEPVSIYIAWLGEKAYATALRAAKTLRAVGFRVEMPAAELKFGKALERASKLNARFALILGDDEVASGQWTLKTLADGSQQKLTEAALLEYLRGL